MPFTADERRAHRQGPGREAYREYQRTYRRQYRAKGEDEDRKGIRQRIIHYTLKGLTPGQVAARLKLYKVNEIAVKRTLKEPDVQADLARLFAENEDRIAALYAKTLASIESSLDAPRGLNPAEVESQARKDFLRLLSIYKGKPESAVKKATGALTLEALGALVQQLRTPRKVEVLSDEVIDSGESEFKLIEG
jgi:hypothetical protein